MDISDKLDITLENHMWYDIPTSSILSEEFAQKLVNEGQRVKNTTNRLLGTTKAEIVQFYNNVKDDIEARFFIDVESYKFNAQLDFMVLNTIKAEDYLKIGKQLINIFSEIGVVIRYSYYNSKQKIIIILGFNEKITPKVYNNLKIAHTKLGLDLKLEKLGVTEYIIEQDDVAYLIDPLRKDEDRVWLFEDDEVLYAAVFDGHGGPNVVNEIMRNTDMFKELRDGDPIVARNIFSALDTKLRKVPDSLFEGSTAVIMVRNKNTGETYFYHVGDSRAVFRDHNNYIDETKDHKPDDFFEKQRIQKTGGFVSKGNVARVDGILATSRAFGDFQLKKPYVKEGTGDHVSAVPAITGPVLLKANSIIVIASDGIWDVIKSKDALEMAAANDAEVACKIIKDTARKLKSHDDISVIVIKIKT